MVHRIIWSQPALDDLNAIADYIALDNPAAARALVRKAFHKTDLLDRSPRLGREVPELPDTPYRELIVPPLRILYRIEDDAIYIVAVIRSERHLTPQLLHEG